MNKRLKLVVDTNIWIKGLFFGRNNPYCAKIIRLISNHKFILVFAQDTIGELVYMIKTVCISLKKDDATSLAILNKVIEAIYYGINVNTENTIAPSCKDKNDNMFIKCAIEGNADYIISNDYASGMQQISNVTAIDSKKFIDIYYDSQKDVASDIENTK